MTDDVLDVPALQVALPGTWRIIDISDPEQSLARMEERLDELPQEASPYIDAFRRYAALAEERAREVEVTFAAVLADVADDGVSPIVATMTVAYGLPEEITQHTETSSPVGGDDRRERSGVTSVTLPVGPAARIEHVAIPDVAPGASAPMSYSVQYLFPVTQDVVAIVTFASPMVGLRRDLSNVFAEIAESLRFAGAPSAGPG